ncbi:rhodanese-like domain-containing protein [Clostridium cylindrosporum]|nr:rhodanese-like domain-containing protein [Clostridium cylindrosporum]
MKKVSLVLLGFILIFSVILSGCSKKVAVVDSKQGEKIAQSSKADAFITPKQLKSIKDKGDKELILIGVLDPKKSLIPGNISASPIEGTFTVWRSDYTGKGSKEAISPEVSGYRKSKEEIENLLSKAGATEKSKIVIYSADKHHDAARLYWQIKTLGHSDVRFLDGGLNAWVGAGYPTGKGRKLADESKKTEYKAPSYNIDNFDANINKVTEALNNPNEWVVIDTRSKDEFDGKTTPSSKGAFGTGRIRGTINIDWSKAVNKEDTTIKSMDELKAIYGDKIKGKKVIAFCQSGVRSAFTYMILTNVLGAKDVYNYDGSWIEWSYVASEASKGKVDKNLRDKVINLTEVWTDNKSEIK